MAVKFSPSKPVNTPLKASIFRPGIDFWPKNKKIGFNIGLQGNYVNAKMKSIKRLKFAKYHVMHPKNKVVLPNVCLCNLYMHGSIHVRRLTQIIHESISGV